MVLTHQGTVLHYLLSLPLPIAISIYWARSSNHCEVGLSSPHPTNQEAEAQGDSLAYQHSRARRHEYRLKDGRPHAKSERRTATVSLLRESCQHRHWLPAKETLSIFTENSKVYPSGHSCSLAERPLLRLSAWVPLKSLRLTDSVTTLSPESMSPVIPSGTGTHRARPPGQGIMQVCLGSTIVPT